MAKKNCELNKIGAAILLALVVAAFSSVTSKALYAAAGQEDKKRGYEIAANEAKTESAPAAAGAPAAKAAAADDKPVDIAPLLAKADVKAGEQSAKKCAACHTFDKGGKNGVGPNQFGLVGGHFAHKDDFKYSPAITALKDKKVTPQALSEFLTDPKKYAPGNKMAFAGVKDAQERANIIAYLSTLK